MKGYDLADFLIKQDWKQYRNLTKKTESKENEYSGIKNRIGALRKGIEQDKNRIEFLRKEIPRMESAFIQAAKKCKIEWFRPERYYSKQLADVNEFIYWTN